jgi:hypothetical protein
LGSIYHIFVDVGMYAKVFGTWRKVVLGAKLYLCIKKGIGGAIPFFSIFHNFSILIILQYEISNEDQLSMVKASLSLLFCDVCPHSNG